MLQKFLYIFSRLNSYNQTKIKKKSHIFCLRVSKKFILKVLVPEFSKDSVSNEINFFETRRQKM